MSSLLLINGSGPETDGATSAEPSGKFRSPNLDVTIIYLERSSQSDSMRCFALKQADSGPRGKQIIEAVSELISDPEIRASKVEGKGLLQSSGKMVWTGSKIDFARYVRLLVQRSERSLVHPDRSRKRRYKQSCLTIYSLFDFPEWSFDLFYESFRKCTEVDAWEEIDTEIASYENDFVRSFAENEVKIM